MIGRRLARLLGQLAGDGVIEPCMLTIDHPLLRLAVIQIVHRREYRTEQQIGQRTQGMHQHRVMRRLANREMKRVIEPRVGGRWYEVGEDGSQCEWGRVLAWEPPAHLRLSWHLNGKFQYDNDVESEVDIYFIAENANVTRIELEHRIMAPDAEALRAGVDSSGGWSVLLESFAKEAAA